MTHPSEERRLVFGTFYALVDGHGRLVCNDGGDPHLFVKPGPHFESNAQARGRTIIKVRIVEARDE